jgi:hypothetical protein
VPIVEWEAVVCAEPVVEVMVFLQRALLAVRGLAPRMGAGLERADVAPPWLGHGWAVAARGGTTRAVPTLGRSAAATTHDGSIVALS